MSDEIQHSPTSSHFRRFRLLLWKSFLWHRHYWWWTIIEILARCFAALFFGLMASSNVNPTNKLPVYPPVHTRSDFLDTITSFEYLAYTPSNKFTDQLMENMIKRLKQEKNLNDSIELVHLPTEYKMVEYMVNRSIYQNQLPMGIYFELNRREDYNKDNFTLPDEFTYEVRQSIAQETRWLIEEDLTPGPYKKNNEYWIGGFAALQLLINEEFIRMKLNDSSWSAPFNFTIQGFPYPEYETSTIQEESLLAAIVLVLIATEVALSVPFIASIIIEKQNGVKNLMRIHHTEEALVWCSWFLEEFIVILISITLMTLILKTPFKGHATESVRFVSFSVLWAFFLLFSSANLSLVLFLSSLFNKAAIASLFHMSVHYFSLVLLFVSVGLNLKQTIHIFWPSPTFAIMKGVRFLITAETHGVPFDWTTAGKLHSTESAMVFFPYLLVFVVEMVFYFLLAFFFGLMNPDEYASKNSPFHVLLSLTDGNKQNDDFPSSYQVTVKASSSRMEIREPVAPEHQPSLVIEGLHIKIDELHSLDKIDLEFYENEISVLLGPKNSGKTTLFSILAGSINFDDGHIFYKGVNVTDDLDILKNDLGICFKEDRLFHYMSILEHLIFFGMLKGLSRRGASQEAEQFLVKMEMHHDRHLTVSNLSKLTKRKLCIAICLIGERKILMLDEPLDGLDYNSKSKIWNLLSDMRSDRTIIMSTSNVREAESLADRITIMETGSVIAHGTPAFLKNSIGIHYEIIVSANKEHFKSITKRVKRVVNATVQRETENEIVYRVPATDLHQFSNLFENLERNSQTLEITNINVTVDTIEHVLMKTGGLTGHSSVKPEHSPGVVGSEYDAEFVNSKKGVSLRFHQLWIIFRKKFLYTMKDFLHIFKRIIMPSLIAILVTRLIELSYVEPFLTRTLIPSLYHMKQIGLSPVVPRVMLHRRKPNKTDDMYKSYSSYVQAHGGIIVDSSHPSLVESLLLFAKHDLMQYRRELLAVFSLNETETLKIMYNLFPIHSLPIAISIYSNVLLRNTLIDETIGITTRSHPVPSAAQGCHEEEWKIKNLLILGVLYFTFSFLTMDLVLYLFEFSHKEMANGLMYLQIMSGVPAWIYWFATFLFDFLFFTVVIAFRLALFVFIDSDSLFFRLTPNFGYFVLVTLLFGMSGLIYVYIFSFYYKPTRTQYYAQVFLFNFACSVGVAISYSFNSFPAFTGKRYEVHRLLEVLFLWMPFLNFPWTVLQYMAQWWYNNQCSILCSRFLLMWCIENHKQKPFMEYSTPDNMHAILLEVIFLCITFAFGVILLVVANYGFGDFLHNLFKSRKFSEERIPQGEEMIQEKVEIEQIKEDDSVYHQTPFLADGLGKSYVKILSLSSVVAVEDVSFVAEHGSNFGILGGQGAGKTTTFHMMAGKVVPTTGNVSVDGVQPRDWKQYYSLIGYCPETSPLIDKFTGRQMLQLIVSLRGVEHVDAIVDEWISITGFEELQHVKCNLYTNSDKRVLSTALAMIGNPDVILLDEPTRDVDSITRRHLYDIMEYSKHSGKTVILASSSSNECELLCDRLTILIDGAMKCIGNPYDLKKHHSLGYFLTIKIHPDITSFLEVVRLEKNILAVFTSKNCRLLEEYKSMLHYQILDDSLPLSVIFRNMEEIKNHNPVIEDYTVTTTTIQDIFDSFIHPTDFFASKRKSGSVQMSE